MSTVTLTSNEADVLSHREPWTTTVGASTSNRHFLSTVTLTSNEADVLQFMGASVTDGIFTPTDVVLASDFGDELCLNPFAADTFSGEIVICRRGVIARVQKSFNVQQGGAGGLILYNPVLQGLSTDNHFIPSIHIENDDGAALLSFMATHTGVMGTMTEGQATKVQGDKMAAFSSRGGPGQTLGISKPDVTAPGVQILAGNTPLPATVVGGQPGELFQSIQGTSMSGPHVAGAAALVKDLHPDWTPGQIKSALMTTAKTKKVVKEDGVTPGDPFDYGSGRIDMKKAGDPGLTISDTGWSFLSLENQLWHANYPSLYVPVHPGIITVERTVKDVGKAKSKKSKKSKKKSTQWKVKVDAPGDVHVTVPKSFKLKKDGEETISTTVDARNVPIGETRHANIEMKAEKTKANFPITIVRGKRPSPPTRCATQRRSRWVRRPIATSRSPILTSPIRISA